jgi:hypothetical protein
MTDMTSAPPPGYRATTCPRCGGPFACGVGTDRSTPCFCVAFALGAERLAQLRARYRDCLCAACLAALANEPEERA